MLIKGVYRHYKGPLYRVLHVARHHETNEPFVVYQSLERGTINVREFKDWNELVVPIADAVGVDGDPITVSRFVLDVPEE